MRSASYESINRVALPPSDVNGLSKGAVGLFLRHVKLIISHSRLVDQEGSIPSGINQRIRRLRVSGESKHVKGQQQHKLRGATYTILQPSVCFRTAP